jgi:hypothetical protein
MLLLPKILMLHPSIRVRIVADAPLGPEQPLTLRECSQFMLDVNLAYEVSRMVADPRYSDSRFSSSTFSRHARRLDDLDRLLVTRVSLNSPLELCGHVVDNAPLIFKTILILLGVIEKSIDIKRKLQERPRKSDSSRDVSLPDPKPLRDAKEKILRIQETETKQKTESEAMPAAAESKQGEHAIKIVTSRLVEDRITIQSIDFEYIKRLEG